jgi:hypothetical protein
MYAVRGTKLARPTTRQIMRSLELGHPNRRWIKQQEIGRRSFEQTPTVWDLEAVCWLARQAPNALFQRKVSSLTDPVRQKVQSKGSITHINQVRTGI